MAFDHRTGPDEVAGFGVARLHFADNAKFTAGVPGDDEAVHDERGGGVAVTLFVFGDFLVPDGVAGLEVQCHDPGVERAEIDLVAVDGGAAVDHVAAGQDALGQARVELPDFLAGGEVDRVEARIGPGHIHHAVMDERLAFLPALLLATQRERPGGDEVLHVVLVERVHRRKTLQVAPHAVGKHVLRGAGVIGEVFFRDVRHCRCGKGEGHGRRDGGFDETVHVYPPMDAGRVLRSGDGDDRRTSSHLHD